MFAGVLSQVGRCKKNTPFVKASVSVIVAIFFAHKRGIATYYYLYIDTNKSCEVLHVCVCTLCV